MADLQDRFTRSITALLVELEARLLYHPCRSSLYVNREW